MLRLLHLSDLHFGPPFLPHVAESVQRFAHATEHDVIVISGDFTQRAKRQQFADAREFMDHLPNVPKVVVPGNHDVPLYRVFERIASPLGLYQELICSELNHHVVVDGAVFVALNTTSPHRTITKGRVLQQQLEYCERVFRSADSGSAKIVVAHHHFAPGPDYERDGATTGAGAALRQLSELDVDLILGGHLHRAYIGNSLDLLSNNAASSRGIPIVQCGTTTSRRGRARERGRNSFNRIVMDEQLIRITRYLHDPASEQFEPASYHELPRDGAELQR